MPETLTAQILAQVYATLTGSTTSLGQPVFTPTLSNLLNINFTNGVGLNQANTLYVDQRTLTASSTEDIDCYAFGAVADQVGSARTNARIKAIIIQNLNTTNANSLSVGGKATSAAFVTPFGSNTDKITVPGNATLMLVCPDATGWTITSGTNLLKILNNSGAASVIYNIVVIGANA